MKRVLSINFKLIGLDSTHIHKFQTTLYFIINTSMLSNQNLCFSKMCGYIKTCCHFVEDANEVKTFDKHMKGCVSIKFCAKINYKNA